MSEGSRNRETYTYPEGDTYEGEWSEEGKKHGAGILKFSDGTTYEGRFTHGLFSGCGVLNFADGAVYKGEFSQGVFNGFGVYVRSDQLKYEGAFKNGRPDGPGIITFPDGKHGNPRQEGFWEGTKLIRRERVKHAQTMARQCAKRALSQTTI
ncbi:MORN repeat-containing protein 4 isoform X2 [Hydra vulgaris]|uniref:MORN repeat-containing protein 4 isoform X2 n=1 Tax=Hydra vulgaris TaxID=6087 RepID=A0ABM4BD63_HYDVU